MPRVKSTSAVSVLKKTGNGIIIMYFHGIVSYVGDLKSVSLVIARRVLMTLFFG